jgi:pyruvate dehydrogenase (quinone)/pyruvate oxidase
VDSTRIGLRFPVEAGLVGDARPTQAPGDGGFSSMAELATCVKYNLPVKVIVIKNNTLGQIKWEQMVFLAIQYGYDLQPIDYAMFARACGAASFQSRIPTSGLTLIRRLPRRDPYS